jgi:drug/metabolite transporter (DMT)-like permease
MTSTLSAHVEQPTRQHQWTVALAALLAAGLLLAISTNLAKVAHGIGVTPLAYLTWSLAGATLLLMVIAYFRGQTTKLNRRLAEYFIISGLLSVAGSNLIFFNAVVHLGVSFVALMLALPPLLTYVGALMLRMETFCWWRATGVGLALVGTTLLVVQKWAAPNTDPVWIAITLIGPVLISAGNLYRTRRWPPGATAESLAPGMLMGALFILILFALVPGWSLTIPTESIYAGPLIVIQAVVFAGQFLLLFVLQKTGGPVFLSLMGGVSALFGVPIAMRLLAEPALPAILPAATLVAAGIVCMVLGMTACQRRVTH